MSPHTEDLDAWLARVTVDPSIHALRPDYCAGLMVIAEIRSGPSGAESEAWLARAESAGHDGAVGQIELWRDTYRSFGAKPSRTRSSLDSLVRRAGAGPLPRINRITDVYNAISILHGVPIGVEDVDRYHGDLRLVRATGDETFLTADHGEPIEELADPGEPIWRDDLGATCRRWNWRQTTRTAITESTRTAVFVVDGLGTDAGDRVRGALDALVHALAPGSSPTTRLIRSP